MNNEKIYLNCVIEVNKNEILNMKDKFDFIEYVAEILFKRDIYMFVPELVKLMNELGYRTDYDSEYVGERGSYRLISASYHRMLEKHGEYFANKLAGVFRKPDNSYAYEA